MVFPDATAINIVSPRVESGTRIPSPLTEEFVKALHSGNVVLFVFGRMDYEDVFRRAHWVTFCSYLGGPLMDTLVQCRQHNDSDD